ncbi:Serine/threonine-protein kinase Tel1 [Mycena kentingensis (nom. inval.)]|nr:Serine/threonine-protein kinase Tel1 [Mycena kentingensis (nom. inval.)]
MRIRSKSSQPATPTISTPHARRVAMVLNVDQLRGDLERNAKDRKTALDQLTDALESQPVWSTKNCVSLLEALQRAFGAEQTAAVSGNSAASARCNIVATLIRRITVLAAPDMEWKNASPLIRHLHSTCTSLGGTVLWEKVAPEYTKALRALLECEPNMDRMDALMWLSLVEFAFNVVLNDPLRRTIASSDFKVPVPMSPDAKAKQREAPSPNTHETTTMDVDEPPPKSGKRRRTTPPPSPPSKRHRSLVPDVTQTELVSCLRILLASPSAPLLVPQFGYLPTSILSRLCRFIDTYSSDASLFQDFLHMVLHTLSHLALNHKDLVMRFARDSWSSLVDLWGTKNKGLKECLAAVLYVLLPFLKTSRAGRSQTPARIASLLKVLEGEADSRWGAGGLLIEYLRLEIAQDGQPTSRPFCARTFRAANNFSDGQALTWTILEMQADCIEELFQFSEDITQPVKNPVTTLLASLNTTSQPQTRAYRLQTLLFVIDKHWLLFHDELQEAVFTTLKKCITLSDQLAQSWALMCAAAIAYADVRAEHVHPRDWDHLWAHALRRTNVPNVARAACHAAQVMLSCSQSPSTSKRISLSSQSVLIEIEGLVKDLDVQGPPLPYDSVCAFLSDALRLASQDVRLHRKQFEEKALAWLVDCWTPGRSVGLHSCTVHGVMLLLETICGVSRRSNLFYRSVLPDCLIAKTVIEQGRTRIIRDYALSAMLPRPMDDTPRGPSLFSANGRRSSDELVEENAREKRISNFLMKSLDALILELSALSQSSAFPTADKARSAVDWAVTGLVFQSILALNGTRPNRRVIQAACKTFQSVIPLLCHTRWKEPEQATILLGLEPLTATKDIQDEMAFSEAFSSTDLSSGVKTDAFSAAVARTEDTATRREEMQVMICKSADVQDCFNAVFPVMRDLLRRVAGLNNSTNNGDDGFDMYIRSADSGGRSSMNDIRYIADVCISFLIVIPARRSDSNTPTNDSELTDLVFQSINEFDSIPHRPFILLGVYISRIKTGTVAFSIPDYERFLRFIGGTLLRDRFFARSAIAQSTVIAYLDATLQLWINSTGGVATMTRQLNAWLSTSLVGGAGGDAGSRRTFIRSWRAREGLAKFYDQYLDADPQSLRWFHTDAPDERTPVFLLQMMNHDEDIRVRFRTASLVVNILTARRTMNANIKALYQPLLESYSKETDNPEQVFTRLLSLGNAMIVSSAARGPAYWNLIEIAFYTPVFREHIYLILRRVSQRLHLPRVSALLESYSFTIAHTLKNKTRKTILELPHSLVGYQDRRELAEATLRLYAPTDLVGYPQSSDGETREQAAARGRKAFSSFCNVLRITEADGLRTCFVDIIGYDMLQTYNTGRTLSGYDEFKDALLGRLDGRHLNDADFDVLIQTNVDGIVAYLVRAIREQDYLPDGPIMMALQSVDSKQATAQTFQALVRHRRNETFTPHEPKAPAFPCKNILDALAWFDGVVPDSDATATAYHVALALLAEVHQSILINEQLRLVNALSLWVALRHECFRQPALLQVLLRGATSLLAQSELARAGQSILEWAFSVLRESETPTDSPRFANILIRICCFANDYSQSPSEYLKALGDELRVWIDAQVLALANNPSITRALSAWPYTPSPELAELVSGISLGGLSSVLSDAGIISNKFRLARQLQNHAILGEHDADQFATTDFWRLRECIPPSDQLQMEDIDAFAGLVEMHQGQITSFVTDMRGGHRQTDPLLSNPQEWIIQSLFSMLEDRDSVQSHMAYRTLRQIFSVMPASQWNSLPPGYEDEIGYLEAYPRIPNSRPSRSLDELESVRFREAADDFPRWVSALAILLSDILASSESFYAQLYPILKSDPTFTEDALPVLVRSILGAERQQYSGKPIDSMPCRKILSKFFFDTLLSPTTSTSCARSIVDIVLHLRNFDPPFVKTHGTKSDALAYNKWLAVDYTLLAEKALACGAYTTSFLFLELATDYPCPEWLADDSTNVRLGVEDILYEIYSHIDEPDGFYGINARDTNKFIIKRLHHEKQWNKAFQFHSATLETGRTSAEAAGGLLQALHSFGFHHLAMDTLQKSTLGGMKADMSYQLGWRTETWDLPEQTGEGSPGVSLYNALRAVHRARSPQAIQAVVHQSLYSEMERLRLLGSENLTEIRDAMQSLMCLNQVSHWFQTETQARLSSREPNSVDWASFAQLGAGFEFSDFETIMATRMALVRSARRREERQQIGNMVTPLGKTLVEVEKACLLRLSEGARQAQQTQIALNSVVRAQSLEQTSSLEVSIEFANVLRLQKEEKLAANSLKILDISGLPPAERAIILGRLGTWMAEACLESPAEISAQYFNPAAALLNAIDSKHLSAPHAAVYRQYATFAEHQYKIVKSSKDVVRWKVYVERKKRELQHRQTQGESRESKRIQDVTKRIEWDEASYKKHLQARDNFLDQAIKMQSRALAASEDHDVDGAIRLCSLWFENFNEARVEFQALVSRALARTPSWKLVFLAHQLSARISRSGNETPKNQKNLQDVVLRMCMEHPFHSIYQVFSLLPIEEQQPSTRRTSGRQSLPSTPQATCRAAAASNIFHRLRGIPACTKRLKDIETVATACMQWAKHAIKGTSLDPGNSRAGHSKSRNIPSEMVIRKVRNVEVPVMTCTTPLDKTLQYKDCVFIDKFDTNFETAGGINLPKITRCIGRDGNQYKQLFKGEGNDDLRQDAVMEQVFSLCNFVLGSDRETSRRSLNVRGYNIVPLGAQSGILEFVTNTTPLNTWISPAHTRYHPTDMDAGKAYMQLKTFHDEHRHNPVPEKYLANFRAVKARFRPVMRHFFTEKHKTPMAWFTMRLAYTRSVATTSIVGHVLGLGDRHCSNILIDTSTGEVVHIDLGIAFDQGKLLSVPERVPFRMTADIVDGMGSMGTQGVFQRCAEETLRVLREGGSEVILTVLEVFKHDPLHSWTASEIKLKNVQEGASRPMLSDIGIDLASGNAEEEADRALTGVARKLDKSMSVEYMVNELIAEATDETTLATMWPGWGQYF